MTPTSLIILIAAVLLLAILLPTILKRLGLHADY